MEGLAEMESSKLQGRRGIMAVTGGTGFVGRVFVRAAVREGWHIRLLMYEPNLPAEMEDIGLDVVRGSFEKLDELLAGAEVCVHMAGEIRNEDRMKEVNVDGPRKVIDASRRQGIRRLVHLSSAGVVGAGGRYSVVDETTPLNPSNAYEQSKMEGEQAVMQDVQTEGLVRVALRPTIIFGPGKPSATDSMYQLMQAMIRGRYVHVDGGQGVYNLLFVEDLVDVVLQCASGPIQDGSVYYLNDPITFARMYQIVTARAEVSGRCWSMPASLAHLIVIGGQLLSMITRKPFPLTAPRLASLRNRICFSDQLIRKELGWQPPVGVERGIVKTLDWLGNSKD